MFNSVCIILGLCHLSMFYLCHCVTTDFSPSLAQMCVHVMKQKKCHYIGNCSFAHSLEERDVWTYMKNNSCKTLAPPAIRDKVSVLWSSKFNVTGPVFVCFNISTKWKKNNTLVKVLYLCCASVSCFVYCHSHNKSL